MFNPSELSTARHNSPGGQSLDDVEDDADFDMDPNMTDPHMREKIISMKHQEYRNVTLGAEDLLNNGQMVQVAISDPFDETKFYPTDKIILIKYKN